MPILLRIIAQRIITAILAFMTFLGLSPEATIPTNQEVQFRIEEQRRIVEQVLELKSTKISAEGYDSENIIKVIDNAAEKINEKRAQIENNPTQSEVTIKDSKSTVKNTPENTPVQKAPTKNEDSPNQTTSAAETKDTIQVLPAEGKMNTLADVVVNIICTQKGRGFTKASTGSGVLISPEGVVLTNAHVAQFFLLEDVGKDVECGIYRENIPTFGYKADLIYISPKWVEANKNLALEKNPRGTGERDYAFLKITENTNPVLSLPDQFSYAPIMLNENIYDAGRKISIGGFPGSPLSILDLTKSGSLQTDTSEITEIFTIEGKQIDIFSTDETPVAAKGASGGGVFYNNNLIGITVTVSSIGEGAKINAITTTYINNNLEKEAGFNLNDMINQNSSSIQRDFQNSILEDLAGTIYQNL